MKRAQVACQKLVMGNTSRHHWRQRCRVRSGTYRLLDRRVVMAVDWVKCADIRTTAKSA